MAGRCSSVIFLLIIARANVPWSAVWRGSRCAMDTNRHHRASEYALQSRKMAIALPDEFQESVSPCTNRALRAVCGRSVFFGNLPANHLASECALECCLAGFKTLDGHKSMPSRELICPGGPWKADSGAR